MSKQGKKKKNNHLSAERRRQSVALSIQDSKVYAIDKNNKIQRNILAVLIVAVIGVLITFVFEEENSENIQVNVPENSKPVADVTVQQGNKLTNVIASSKKPLLNHSSLPEINEPDISELVSNEVDWEEDTFAQEETELAEDAAFANNNNANDIELKEEDFSESSEAEDYVANTENTASGIESVWVSHIVAPGDTLAKIFRGKKLPLSDLYAIAAIEGEDKPLSKILPNQELRFKLNEAAALDALEILSRSRNIVFVRTTQGNFIRQQ